MNTFVLDFETTGLNPFHNKIIEYAFLRETDKSYIECLINPKVKFKFICFKAGCIC